MAVKGSHLSEKTKEKLRLKMTGRKASQETREKQSLARKGKSFPCRRPLGIPVSEQTKEKLRRVNQGKKASPETKKKMSEVRAGKTKSDETRKRMSDSRADLGSPSNIRRSEGTSRSNVARHLAGTDFYVKGYHTSPKSGSTPIPYRSVLIELSLMNLLDGDPSVDKWVSPVTVTYLSPNGAKKHALPDFLVTHKDGRRYIIEGKGSHLLSDYMRGEKFAAVESWCRENQIGFYIAVARKKNMGFWWEEVVPCRAQ